MKSLNIKALARLLFAAGMLYSGLAFGQTANSNTSGPWNNTGTWSCNCIPTAAHVVTIRNNHTVTIPSGYTALGASLTVQNGTVLRNQAATVPTIPTITFQNGSQYDHNVNGGTIPTATWSSGSTCLITGTVSALPAGLGQSFHHFTYNSAVQTTANLFFLGNLTTVNGNLTIENTGTTSALANRQVTLGSNSGLFNGTLHVFGNLNVNNLSRVQLASSGTFAVTVDGNFNLNASSSVPDPPNAPIIINNVIVNSSAASATLNIEGDLIINNGGKFNMLTATGALTNLNLEGDFLLTNGIFLRDAAANNPGSVVNMTFSGASPQVYTGGGSYTGNSVNYRIASGSDVNLQTFGLAQPTSTFTNGGIVRLASVDPTSAIVGNIRPNTRTFSPGSTIIYSGAAEQFMGTTHPSGALVTTTIANPNDVTLSADAIIGGTLNLTSGDINILNSKLTVSGTVNAGSNHLNITSSSSLEIGGTGAFGPLPIAGSTDINSFAISRTSGSVIIEQDLTIQGTLTQTAGDIHLDGVDLILNGPFARTTGSIISDDPATTFVLQSTGAVPATAAFSGTFTTFDFNRDAVIMGTSGAFTVGTLLLRRGALDNTTDLIIPSGGTIRRFVGTLGSPVDGSGPLFIIYSNQDDILSGPELTPVTPGRVQDVLLNGSANVFLSTDATISNDLTISSGGFFAQNRTITLEGDLVVDGVADFSQGAIIFDGTTVVSGSTIPPFGTIQVTSGSSLTLPSSSNIPVAGDIDFSATSTVTAPNITLTLNGFVDQTISPQNFGVNNLVVFKADETDVILTSGLRVFNEMTVQTPNTDFNSGGFLRLVSTSDAGGANDAWIGQLVDGASVSGIVHVERNMSDEGKIYRYISSPVSNMSVDLLNNQIPIAGPFPGSSVCANCGSIPSMYSFNNATLSYSPFPTASVNEEMEIGVGYSTYIYQDALGPGAVTLDFVGPINHGPVPFVVGYTDDPLLNWNLVGNPYPATIDWDEPLGWTKGSSIAEGIAVRENGTLGDFVYWDGEDGDLVEGLIAKGQAFWMRAEDDTDLALEINEFAKTSPVPAPFLRTAGTTMDGFILTLTNSGGRTDKAYVKERAGSKLSVDRYDIPKLNNQFFDISTYNFEGPRTPLAINAVEHVDCIEKVGVVIKDVPVGNYVLSINLSGKFSSRNWTLVDKFTKTTQTFNQGTYPFSITSNPASSAAERFELILDIDRPRLDLDVVATTPDVCTDAAVITIPNAEPAFSYGLIVNGVPVNDVVAGSSNLTFKINNDLLLPGANNVKVAVTGGCPENLAKSVSVAKHELVTATTVESRVECEPGSYKIEPSGAENFNWYASSSDATPFAHGRAYTTPSINTTATYYLAAVNDNGCEGPRVSTTVSITFTDAVTIQVMPEDGVIAELVSNYAEGNQWSFNGAAIEGATGQSLTVDKTGRYTVAVTKNGCTETSGVDYAITGLGPDLLKAIAWPNPVAGKLTIDIPPKLRVKTLWLQTTSGVVTDRHNNPSRSVTIDMEQHAPGLYFLMMDTDLGRKVQKIIRN